MSTPFQNMHDGDMKFIGDQKEDVYVEEVLYDMSPTPKGNIELSFTHEGQRFVMEITEKDVRGFTHLFQMFKFGKGV